MIPCITFFLKKKLEVLYLKIFFYSVKENLKITNLKIEQQRNKITKDFEAHFFNWNVLFSLKSTYRDFLMAYFIKLKKYNFFLNVRLFRNNGTFNKSERIRVLLVVGIGERLRTQEELFQASNK